MIELVSVKCPECNGIVKIDSEKDFFFCPYCGVQIARNKDEKTININKTVRTITDDKIIHAETDRTVRVMRAQTEQQERDFELKKAKRKEIVKYVAIGLFVLLVLITPRDTHEGEIKLPIGSTDAVGQNYEIVEKQFLDSGFMDVETSALEDLAIGILDKNGAVDTIAIDGDSRFYSGSYVPANAKIRIYYHSFKEKK